jgi:hypothetical protein
MLTVWLDATECITLLTSKHRLLEDLNNIVRGYVESLPAYQWFTALPTLVSRLCHHSDDVAEILLNIVGKVLYEITTNLPPNDYQITTK